MATLIYTSGTTGRPKGCELTHSNFLFEIENGMSLLGRFLNVDGSILLFIPLAHVLARVIEVGSVKTRTVIGHTPDVKNLLDDLAEFKPTFVLAVPRVFEKVFNSAKAKAEADGKGKIFDIAAQVAIDWSRAQDTGGAGLAAQGAARAVRQARLQQAARRPRRPVHGRDLRRRTRSATGSATSSAASASPSSRATASPRPPRPPRSTTTRRCGSAPWAAPCPASTLAIADDGELLLRGGIVMRGYWKNEKATEETIDGEGWFHTGDLGEIDDDGFLKITGRKKEILVTAGGKNVAPAVLEDRLRSHAPDQPVHRRRRRAPVHRRPDHPRRGRPPRLAGVQGQAQGHVAGAPPGRRRSSTPRSTRP